MIFKFISFLNAKKILYKFTNGYDSLSQIKESNQDYDFLFKKKDFRNIHRVIKAFCNSCDFKLVQVYHQGIYAKNFFLVDPKTNELLNLDIYGELTVKNIMILNEKKVFSYKNTFNIISILNPEDEFIHYLIKNIDKDDLSYNKFKVLKKLYDLDTIASFENIQSFFPSNHKLLTRCFSSNNHKLLSDNILILKNDFLSLPKNAKINKLENVFRIFKRVIKPTGLTICFLGPDGSGKSTVIDGLVKSKLPFRRNDYFHLKPLKSKNPKKIINSEAPHQLPTYGPTKSYIKLIFFVFQYNIGWVLNIFLLKRKSSLIIFDRYFDDLLVDFKRYRFGGSIKLAYWMRYFIPKADLYFILTANADVIYKRKQEVDFDELKRQINDYRKLGKLSKYCNVDVDKSPDKIVNEVFKLIMEKLNGRY